MKTAKTNWGLNVLQRVNKINNINRKAKDIEYSKQKRQSECEAKGMRSVWGCHLVHKYVDQQINICRK